MLAAYFYRSNRDLRIFFDFVQWQNRNLKSKGVLGKTSMLVMKRNMTPIEIKDYENSYRLHFEIYDDWEKLFADEERCQVPSQFIDKLRTFSRTHPLQPQLPISTK